VILNAARTSAEPLRHYRRELSGVPDVAGSRGSDSGPVDTVVERISWRRRGARSSFVGSLSAGDDAICLAGRDPQNGLDVMLSIPSLELSSVHVSPADGNGDPHVVLELEHAQPIFLRQFEGTHVQAQNLARKLAALLRPRPLLTRGG